MADEETPQTLPLEPEPTASSEAASEVVQNVPVDSPPAEAQPIDEASPSAKATEDRQGGTAQMGRNEPLPPEPEPITPVATQAVSSPSVQTAAPATYSIREILAKANAKIQAKKQKKLEKIMVELNKRENISNDEVEKLLHVSDATATRYLSALEKEGRVKQVGKTGKGVVYTKI